jgi:acetyltransferase-like isoleucine patch superfamily enzyme
MRSGPSFSHRLRVRLQKWLDVSPYTALEFGCAGEDSLVDPGVHISDPRSVFLSEGCAIYRGCMILTGPGVLKMGPRSHLAGFVYINALQAGVHIGAGTAVGPYAVLLSYSNAVRPGQAINEARTAADVWVGDDVFIGAGATVLPGITIGDRAVIGAGAVVTRDVPAGQVVGGVPARLLGTRS